MSRSTVLFAIVAFIMFGVIVGSVWGQSNFGARTPWGDPDLQGVWDFRTITPLQRPEDEAEQVFLTEEEAANLEQAAVDRNVLRLAVYEMLHREDIPPVVSINEAVDIAKKFSPDESGKFVNGILDKIKAGLDRPARTATEAA